MLTYELKQSPVNTVIVRVDSALEDTIEYGSMKLHIDPLFNPTHHAKIYGTVIAVPKGKCINENGFGIEKEVMVGDKIYFHYLVTNNETNCIYGNYYKVPYYWIFCAVRDSRIIPVGAWTLCEEVVEQENEYNQVEVLSKKINATVSASGIVTSLHKTSSIRVAKLKFIGKPFIGENELEVKQNDEIILAKNAHFKNKIEGKDYYTVRQEDILGKRMGYPPSEI